MTLVGALSVVTALLVGIAAGERVGRLTEADPATRCPPALLQSMLDGTRPHSATREALAAWLLEHDRAYRHWLAVGEAWEDENARHWAQPRGWAGSPRPWEWAGSRDREGTP